MVTPYTRGGQKVPKWTEEEVASLLEQFTSGIRPRDIKIPTRGPAAISLRISLLRKQGYALPLKRQVEEWEPWTAEEIALVKEQYALKKSPKEIQTYLPYRTWTAIQNRLIRLRKAGELTAIIRKPSWTAEEEALVREQYLAGCQVLKIKVPNRTPSAIFKRVYNLIQRKEMYREA